MDFDAILNQILELVQSQRRVSYRAIKRRFDLDDDHLEDLKEEILFAYPHIVDEAGRGIVWTDSETQKIGSPEPETNEKPSSSTFETPVPASLPDAERRQLTVMFCDVVDSTRLSGQLDPEDLREVLRAYQEQASGVIQHYEGYIAQYLGDGLLVYFGWPRAHEDDAHRAIHAGLGIIAALDKLNKTLKPAYGVQLAMRLGIHTGPVVVGEIGGGDRHENLALGETPNIAARLEGLAEHNTVMISDATRRLVAGAFNYDALGSQQLKGVNESIPIFRVRSLSAAASRFEATSTALTPMVGREVEVDLLMRGWKQVLDGEGQVVLLNGPPGIGKSRLLEALCAQLAEVPHVRLRYQCSPYHTNSALYPVASQVTHAMQLPSDASTNEKLDRLESLVAQTGLPMEETASLFAAMLSIPTDDRYPPLHLSPQRQKDRTIELFAQGVIKLAQQEPVLFLFEDVHWSDPTSLEALGFAIDQLQEARVLAVLTYRPEFDPPWRDYEHVATYTLNRLSRRETVGLIENLTEGKALPIEVVDQIVAKTDGVPLFIEELTKYVLELVWLTDAGQHYQLTKPLPSLAIPASLQDSLMARLDRLSAVKDLAQRGATIGREFSYALLRAVSPLSETALEDALGQLLDADIISQRGSIPERTYIFKHALIQDAAYQSMLRSTRQQVHQQIARALDHEFPDIVETQPEVLAHHYGEAGLGELAVTYWQRAGERARSRAADAEAIMHFRAGLDALTTLPVTPERTNREIDLQTLLALAYTASKGQSVAEVAQAYEKARELCEQVHDDYRLFRALIGLVRCYGVSSDYQKGRKNSRALIEVAERVQDPRLLLEAYMMQVNYLLFDGDYTEARTLSERAFTHYDRLQHHVYVAQSTIDPGVNLLSRLSWALWCQGYPDQALTHNRDMLTLARELGHIHTLVMFSNFGALTHQLCGEKEAVDDLTQYAIQLSMEHGFHQQRLLASILQGWFLTCHCLKEEGLTQMREGLIAHSQTGNSLYQSWCLMLLISAYSQHGHSDAGLTTLTEALAIARPFFQPELYRLKGELLLIPSRESQAEAEACFNRALNMARQQAAKSWELRAATSLARLWQSQGKRQDAYDLLTPVFEWFTEGFDTADLQEAKSLLEVLSS